MANAVKINVDELDVKRVFSWIMDASSNTRVLWNTVEPLMKMQVSRQFSDENPNNWKPLKQSYLDWKVSQGYPKTIGVRKGYLKEAATDKAIISKERNHMTYSINTDIAVQAEGYDYFSKFHKQRKIFKHTTRYMNKLYYEAAESWINNSLKESKRKSI